MNKFAPMTANLLVRKGGAAPSQVFGTTGLAALAQTEPHSEPAHEFAPRRVAPRPHPRPAHTDAAPQPGHEHERRMMVWIKEEDLERLEIAAIKKGTTRHEIASKAIDLYLRALAEEFPSPCGCVSGSCRG